MCGSGGRFSPYVSGQVTPQINDAKRRTEASDYERKVEENIRQHLREENDRDPAALAQRNERLAEVTATIEDYLDESVSTLFGGSVSRRTDVQGISDVDALMLLDETRFATENPQDLLREFEDLLRSSLPNSVVVERGPLAVTLTYEDGLELQLLPALRTSTGVRIAASEGDGWSNVIHPDRFARRLTEVNQSNNNRVVPVIKIVRQMVEQFAPDSKPRGHHIEALAIEAFQGYQGELTTKPMVEHLIQAAASRVISPIVDRTGQSNYLDGYLEGRDSGARQRLAGELARLASRLQSANEDLSVQGWMGALDE